MLRAIVFDLLLNNLLFESELALFHARLYVSFATLDRLVSVTVDEFAGLALEMLSVGFDWHDNHFDLIFNVKQKLIYLLDISLRSIGGRVLLFQLAYDMIRFRLEV